tara:strand:- start:161 stop:1099 length:939 start_codon:yes stop_codon:yes gene_type:complete
MKRIKKIIFFILLSLIFIEKANAGISDSLFMTIGNKPVTKSDVVDEIKIILILNNESYSDEKREILHQLAVKQIIKRNIKKIEIEKKDFLKISQKNFEKELIQLANKLNMDLDTLKSIFESNGIDFKLVEDQIMTELFWNALIFEIYKSRLKVDSEEIEERLKSINNENQTEEYLISEILIKLENKENFKSEVEKLKNRIEIEGFEAVAKNLSISESSENGGDLGWLNENVISDKIKTSISNTSMGSLSEPILIDGTILIFKIRNKRKIDNKLSLEEAKEEMVKSEKLKILNMHSLSHYDKLRRMITVKFFQ